jgi:hypothetical protein
LFNRDACIRETFVLDRPQRPTRTISAIWQLLKDKLLQLNLFKSELSWDDDRLGRREIITTRIFLLTLLLAVVVLIIYTLIDTQTRIVTVLSPSQQQFDQLRLSPQSSATLDCFCQNIIVPYDSFISIEPHYHQLCSSDFVASNSTWIYLLYSSEAGEQYSYDDFRLFVMPQFRALISLCTLAKETVNEAINQFSTNIVTNERVQSPETIEIQAESALDQFLLSTPRTFIRTLDFIRYMAQGNGIVSTVLSNWHFLSGSLDDEYPCLWAEPRYYGDDNCSCATNAMCTSQASFNGSNVPGFRVGCYPLEALFQSTLECLYNVTCIDQLKSMYNQSNITFNPLDATLSSPNMTVQSLLDVLLIERWETSVVYENYYATCTPLSCVYTFSGQVSLVYTVTTIIGLYGGLSVALKVIIPLLVKIGHYVITRHRQRVEPVVAMTTMTVIRQY